MEVIPIPGGLVGWATQKAERLPIDLLSTIVMGAPGAKTLGRVVLDLS